MSRDPTTYENIVRVLAHAEPILNVGDEQPLYVCGCCLADDRERHEKQVDHEDWCPWLLARRLFPGSARP